MSNELGVENTEKVKPESELNEFEPRLKSVKKTVSIERRLKS